MTEPAEMTRVPAAADITAVQAGPAGKRERVGFSAGRVWVVALNTFTEAVRQKVFNFLLLFALVLIAMASFFTQFSFQEQLKSMLDTCLGAVSIFGTLIAIVGTALVVPSEVENRTIYTVLAKPVRRVEFLLGKYAGSLLLIFTSLLLMTLLFGAVLVIKERSLVHEAIQRGPDVDGVAVEETVRQIQARAYDPSIIKGLLLIFAKQALLAAITLLASTFSTSMVFNVAVGAMSWIAGSLYSGAAEMWTGNKWAMSLLAVVPDLGLFDVVDDIVVGNAVGWGHVGDVLVYGLGRIAIIVFAAHLIFSRREI